MDIQDLPVISIVTPSLNQAEFIEECLDSVLSQGYPRLEYVVMDGGSTDGSVEIIRRFATHLTHWESRPDGGQYAAIGAGFAHTSGGVMAWLNSDDKYPPLALARVGWLFANRPEVEWVSGRPLAWDAHGGVHHVDLRPVVPTRERFLEGHFVDPHIQQESTFWRRQLWERAGGRLRHDLSLAGDLELWLRFFRLAPLHIVDAFLGGFRLHGRQKSALEPQAYRREAEALLAAERAREDAGPLPARPAPERLSLPEPQFRAFVAETGIGGKAVAGDQIASFLLKATLEAVSERERIGAQLVESEADRANRLEVILRGERLLQQQRDHIAALESKPLDRLLRRLRQMLRRRGS